VCCWTHPDGWQARHPEFELAENENWQCRCGYGGPNGCPRKATREDLLCDVCSGRSSEGADDAGPLPSREELARLANRDLVDGIARYWEASPPPLTNDVPMEAARGMYQKMEQRIDWDKVKLELGAPDPGANIEAALNYAREKFGDGVTFQWDYKNIINPPEIPPS
jgi:hypothetical protein